MAVEIVLDKPVIRLDAQGIYSVSLSASYVDSTTGVEAFAYTAASSIGDRDGIIPLIEKVLVPDIDAQVPRIEAELDAQSMVDDCKAAADEAMATTTAKRAETIIKGVL